MIQYFNYGKQDMRKQQEAGNVWTQTEPAKWQKHPGDIACVVTQMEQASFADAWTETMVTESLCQSYNHLWIAFDDSGRTEDEEKIGIAETSGGACGYLLANMLGDETELLRVAVNPAYRRKGIAQALIEAYFSFAQTNAARGLLEVRHGNTAAKQLYEKNGYHLLASRKNYYKHPDEDADIYEITFTENGE